MGLGGGVVGGGGRGGEDWVLFFFSHFTDEAHLRLFHNWFYGGRLFFNSFSSLFLTF